MSLFCYLLLEQFSQSATDFVFFTDQKMLSVASPENRQNDRVYAPCEWHKETQHCRWALAALSFSKSLMVKVR